MIIRQKKYQACDTLFYQGANNPQTQALKYTGKQKILATTGEMMWSVGKNKLAPLNVIFHLHIGVEIADVNLCPYDTYTSYFNPIKLINSSVTKLRHHLEGVKIDPAVHTSRDSLASHTIHFSKVSYGQTADIDSLHAKYLSWLKRNDRNKSLILWGVSRGTSPAFCAYTKHRYPEVKLVVLEGAIDSIENIVKNISLKTLKSETAANAAVKVFKKSTDFLHRNNLFGYHHDGESPLKFLDDFPTNVPVVFITSKKDSIVPPENTANIAFQLAKRGKNDVYLLILENSRHPFYMYDDQADRDMYEAFIHAIYRRYGFEHDSELADKGEQYLDLACLATANVMVMKRNVEVVERSLGLFRNEKSPPREQIIQQLTTIGFNREMINNILTSVQSWPASSNVLNAINFLTKLPEQHSICEDYHQHSNLIAEYYSTISNVGFFAVALYYKDYYILAAAILSALSHAIPLKRLNELDKLAAVVLFLKIASQYDVLVKHPEIVPSFIPVILFGALDILVGRKNKETLGASLHVAWHLAAAFALSQFKGAEVMGLENNVAGLSI